MVISLSYIIATRNRLPFLKITLGRLIASLQPDEEIVLVDGNSTDGSKEYLHHLFEQGKIHQFISEPDKNQAHAWNKALLMAKGTIIKKIIDDDVFYYDAIRKCKQHMLENPDIDVVISNDVSISLGDTTRPVKNTRLPQFVKWRSGTTPSFTFGDSHMLIRRSALAYIGLYNPRFVMMDWEYALRISYIKVNITYYTGYNALNVAHSQTVSMQKNEHLIINQGKRAEVFYKYKGDRAEISNWSKMKIFIGKQLNRRKKINAPQEQTISAAQLHEIYDQFYQYLADINTDSFNFIN